MVIKEKLQEKVQKAKENLVLKVMNQSNFYFIFKWLFTNRVSVILFFLLLSFAGSYYHLRTEYLYERNKILLDQNKELLNGTVDLKEKIKQFQTALDLVKDSFNENINEASKLSDFEKKNKILLLIEKLKNKRNSSNRSILKSLKGKLN